MRKNSCSGPNNIDKNPYNFTLDFLRRAPVYFLEYYIHFSIRENALVQQKAIDLFHAYTQNKIPEEGGCIISSFLDPDSSYAKYEIVAYKNATAVYLSSGGLTFRTDGNKLYILVEPPDYARKDEEPFERQKTKQIPHRFSELEILSTRKQKRVMVSKKPVMVYSSFLIAKPENDDFAFLFYNRSDALESVTSFFEETLAKENGLEQAEIKKVVPLIQKGLKKFTVWQA